MFALFLLKLRCSKIVFWHYSLSTPVSIRVSMVSSIETMTISIISTIQKIRISLGISSRFCFNIPNVHMNKDIHIHSEHILVHVHNIRHTEDKDQLQVLLQQIFSFCPNIHHIPSVHSILHRHMDIHSTLHTIGRDQPWSLQKDQLQQS